MPMSSKDIPKVSIIIPFYKNLVYLEECVKHCLTLDYPNYEVSVVSNSPIKLPYERVKVLVTDKLGQAYKKDLGAAYASGEICAFIDDDAYPSKDWLKNAFKYFDDPNVVAAGGPGVTSPNDGLMQKASGLIYSLAIGSGKFSHRYVVKETDNVDELPGYNLLVRKSFLKEIGGINVDYRSGEDSILSQRIVKQGKKFRYAPDVIVYHHRRPLFMGHLKQVSSYALHRGYFAKKHPETSAKLFYMLPSILLIAIAFWTLLSMPIPMLRLPLVMLIAGYFALSFISALLASRSLKLSVLTSVGVALTHLTYGIFFMKGMCTKELGERPSY
jgi:cellulose synthase/poly-beta-1,6-N-acetylglucosamine synthase-like glycosyltransferase